MTIKITIKLSVAYICPFPFLLIISDQLQNNWPFQIIDERAPIQGVNPRVHLFNDPSKLVFVLLGASTYKATGGSGSKNSCFEYLKDFLEVDMRLFTEC